MITIFTGIWLSVRATHSASQWSHTPLRPTWLPSLRLLLPGNSFPVFPLQIPAESFWVSFAVNHPFINHRHTMNTTRASHAFHSAYASSVLSLPPPYSFKEKVKGNNNPDNIDDPLPAPASGLVLPKIYKPILIQITLDALHLHPVTFLSLPWHESTMIAQTSTSSLCSPPPSQK